MADAPDTLETPRLLGAWPATAVVAGTMLGVGIYIGPPQVAAKAGSAAAFFALWIAGGLAALCGALSVAELSAMVPRNGGHYLYLKRAYSPGVGFAAGWLEALAVMPGSIGAVALATAQFQMPVLLGDWASRPVPVFGVGVPAPFLLGTLIVLVFTAINHVGVVISGRAQLLLTFVPVAVLFVVTIAILALDLEAAPREAVPAGTAVGMLALAYLPVHFAYAGWDGAIYVAGEVKDPSRVLPRALLGGTIAVTTLYAVLCAGYVSVLGMSDLAGAGEAGSAVAGALFGGAGVGVMTALIATGVLGSLNAQVLAGSRITFAMAREGQLPRVLGRLHPLHGTPALALWAQAAWTILLMALGGVDQLVTYATTAMLIVGALSVAAVAVLRRREPDLPRPYRVPLYPLPLVAFCAASLLVLGVLSAQGDVSVLISIGWFVAALVVHRLARVRRAANG